MEKIKKYILQQLVENKLSRDEAKQLLNETNVSQASGEIAVVGIACKFPGAKNKEEYWELLASGKSAISSYSEQRLSDINAVLQNRFARELYFGPGGELVEDFGLGGYFEDISRFDAAFFSISPKEAKYMDPYHRLFLETAWEAVEDAGYGGKALSGSKTGVFVGRDHAEISSYQLVTEQDPLHFTGSYSSILASRIAYLFNWQGPCVVLDTACSSGLVALHTACRSLQANDCDMAVAGGISLMNSPVKDDGLKMIESKDGCVRTFDKDATGTMLSEGVGIVVLKTLKKALQDNDHIYAVIKGSSINNDGASTGITAPNVEAQYQVILNAWKNSNVPPETISYIEAHGTGTVLGDPIEFEGLSNAFRKFTDKKQFCGIGSAKTNIGHTVGASGIAGLIKIILSMQHKMIPANLNFKEANPYIDFNNSPFYVVNEAKSWDESDSPRRAGISSFGFSGTNCHVVVEEAEHLLNNRIIRRSKPHQELIFTLSAKSREALLGYVKKYIQFFSDPTRKSLSLEDVCYTSTVGRGHYSERLAIMVRSLDDVKNKLLRLMECEEWECLRDEQIYYGKHRIVPSNKKVLEDHELSDHQLATLNGEMNAALIRGQNEALNRTLAEGYVRGAEINWEVYFQGIDTCKASLPTYPFERKRYWAEARTDEAFNDAGKKTGLPLVHRAILDNPEVMVFESTFNERKDWILHEHRIFDQSIIPATAYLEMALEAVSKYLGAAAVEFSNIYYRAPLIADLNQTVNVQTVVRKLSAGYEFKFYSRSGEISTLLAEGTITELARDSEPKRVNVEDLLNRRLDIMQELEDNDIEKENTFFGARWNNLVSVSKLTDQELLVEASMPEAFADEIGQMRMHPAILDSSINVLSQKAGNGIYLPIFYKSIKLYSKLPSRFYCMMKQLQASQQNERETVSFHLQLIDLNGNVIAEIENYTLKRVRSALTLKLSQDRVHRREWIEEIASSSVAPQEVRNVLVFMRDKNDMARELIHRLEQQGSHVIKAFARNEYRQVSETEYWVDISRQTDFQRLFEAIDHSSLSHLVYLFDETGSGLVNEIELDNQMEYGVYGLSRLVKAIIQTKLHAGSRIVIAGKQANRVTGKETELSPVAAAIQGFARVIEQEYNQYLCRFIDYDETTAADTILSEIVSPSSYYACAYRDNKRYIPSLISEPMQKDSVMPLKEQGVYLITGGGGGIGLEIANYIASQKNVHFVLINRSPLPDRAEWERVVKDSPDSRIAAKITKMMQIEEKGSSVITFAVDVTDAEKLSHALQSIREAYGKIDGVIHGAGVAGQGFIINKSEQQARETIAPKVKGTYLLDELTRQDELDFFVLFSSVISLVGGHGQADYAAGNSFMDTYASLRSLKGRATQSVNWGMWSEVGMAVDFGLDGSDLLLKPISNDEGFQALSTIMHNSMQGVLFGELNPTRSLDIGAHLFVPQLAVQATNTSAAVNRTGFRPVKPNGKALDDYTPHEIALSQIWGHILEMDSINVYDNFYDLGGDSILALNLVKLINEQFKTDLNVGDLFSSENIVEMSTLLEGYEVPVWNVTEDVIENNQATAHAHQSYSKEDDQSKHITVSARYETKLIQSSIPDMDEYMIKQNVLAGDNYFSWKQMDCYARGIMYMMKINNKPITKYYKLLYALQRSFDIHHPTVYHMHQYINIQNIHEYMNEDFCSFVRKFGFEVEFTDVSNKETLHHVIQGLVKNKKLILIPFDEYYLYYSQYYMKKHTDHHALIYGYSNKKQLYHILNHNHLTINNSSSIEYGPFVAPFSLIEEIIDEIEPYRRSVVTIAHNPELGDTPEEFDHLLQQIFTEPSDLKPVNRISDYVRGLNCNKVEWSDNSSKEFYDYMGALEMFVDILQQEFGCHSTDFSKASSELIKYCNTLLKKYIIKMESKSVVPGDYEELLAKIDQSSSELFAALELHFRG
ncbi:SDR family NAD(P)-dependent oxidoreductase [Paenibacillus xylaniclasticus]|uniref:SDR family NAD(P)-dependent oxidoreductase n=1 Tax=Paenibacillus xylaniclasticus TaxID=588083 RepID=UPI000FDCAB80|nr:MULTISPECIES: SDR family NAD(P)-dependent oxidoreductase [Paenibacillus]GFN30897.1 hypothetical protein PCURB6_11570 [Paenibacillus curdlanolyticus]